MGLTSTMTEINLAIGKNQPKTYELVDTRGGSRQKNPPGTGIRE